MSLGARRVTYHAEPRHVRVSGRRWEPLPGAGWLCLKACYSHSKSTVLPLRKHACKPDSALHICFSSLLENTQSRAFCNLVIL